MEAVQGGPHHALPARADLFEQLVLVERGARVKIVQPDRFGGGHDQLDPSKVMALSQLGSCWEGLLGEDWPSWQRSTGALPGGRILRLDGYRCGSRAGCSCR